MDGEAVTQCLNLPPDLIVVFEHPWLTLFFGAVWVGDLEAPHTNS